MNTNTETLKAKSREEFIRNLAVFLVENQGAKSIMLEMESGWIPDDPRPRLAKAWAEMFHLATLDTCFSVRDAETSLTAFLSPPPAKAVHGVNYVLRRIKNEERLQHLMGAGTESYAQLTMAYSLLTGESVDEVRDQLIPGSASIHREVL